MTVNMNAKMLFSHWKMTRHVLMGPVHMRKAFFTPPHVKPDVKMNANMNFLHTWTC